MPKSILIKVDGTVQEFDTPKFEDCQAAVGGYVQSLPLFAECDAYVNEDGIEKGLVRNKLATSLCFDLEIGLADDDYIKGNLLVVAHNEDGDQIDVPAAVLPLLQMYGRLKNAPPKRSSSRV